MDFLSGIQNVDPPSQELWDEFRRQQTANMNFEVENLNHTCQRETGDLKTIYLILFPYNIGHPFVEDKVAFLAAYTKWELKAMQNFITARTYDFYRAYSIDFSFRDRFPQECSEAFLAVCTAVHTRGGSPQSKVRLIKDATERLSHTIQRENSRQQGDIILSSPRSTAHANQAQENLFHTELMSRGREITSPLSRSTIMEAVVEDRLLDMQKVACSEPFENVRRFHKVHVWFLGGTEAVMDYLSPRLDLEPGAECPLVTIDQEFASSGNLRFSNYEFKKANTR
ncbi:MAG: hypothetical protein LQ342_008117 [Letrouitia transgressa]|nr:MAG: hypothetical protein LQ342_008117 [Letrouitia transgressa]